MAEALPPPILVVDDVRDELLLVERIIQSCKLLNPVHLLETGGDCIRFFEQDSRRDDPSGCILFLDMMMQPTSGLEVLDRVRDLPSARKSLIVMVSGLTDIKAINTGYQLGAATFLIKPLKPEDVLQLITSMGNRVSVEEHEGGYLIQLVPDSGTSFIKKPEIKQPFANLAGRLKPELDGQVFPARSPSPSGKPASEKPGR